MTLRIRRSAGDITSIQSRGYSIFAPPPRLSPSAWGHQFLWLKSRVKFSIALCPYIKEPLDSAIDPDVKSTTLMTAAQLGKTSILICLAGHSIDEDPSEILLVEPTQDAANDWSKNKLAPAIRHTARLESRVMEARSRDSGNTIQSKTFDGGDIAMVGANSPVGLAMRPRRIVLLDEIDRYPESAGTEGDPCALAEKRTESYWNPVIFRTSTPTRKGTSRIEDAFDKTDKRFFFCPCPKCGHFQTLKWKMLRWEPGKTEEAWLQCENEKCEARLSDADRMEMLRLGEWRATAPFAGHRGYHLNGLYSPFKKKRGFKSRLHEFAENFLEAKKAGESRMQVWTNTFLAETFEAEMEHVEPGPLMKRCEAYGPDLPRQVLFLTAGADVHANRIEAEIVGWGEGEESWGIVRKQFLGSPHSAGVWEALDGFVLQEFYHPEFGRLTVKSFCVDSRFATKDTIAYVRRCQPRFVNAVMGSPAKLRQPVERRRQKGAMAMVDTDEFKTVIYSRLRMETPGPRYMHFPISPDYDEEFFAQLTAERVRLTHRKGFEKQEWENVRSNRRNEALDIRVYNGAALFLRKVNFGELAKNLAKDAAQAKGVPVGTEIKTSDAAQPNQPSAQAARAAERRFRSRSSWVNSWRR